MTTRTEGFAILRTDKLKTKAEIKRSLKHSFREQETPNANPELKATNAYHNGTNSDEVMQRINALLPENPRKNAVLAIEYLITASPEAMNSMTPKEQNQYFGAAFQWLKQKHGEANLVHAGIHRDEKTPHMYAYVIPIDQKGKLNCRAFLGGTKHVLADMQTDFYEKVAKSHGLKRGIEGSKAKHQRVQEFYKNINQPDTPVEIPTKRTKYSWGFQVETDEAFAERVKDTVLTQVKPNLEQAKITKTTQRQNESLANTLRTAQYRLKALEMEKATLTEGLTDDEVKRVLEAAREVKKAQRRDYFKNQAKNHDFER
jgi:hypothetical protein